MKTLRERHKLHGERIHAVAEAGRRGAVVEDVAEVAVAQSATDGGAHHHQRAVDGFDDVLIGDGLIEAGPAGAGFEFGFAGEEGEVAATAAEEACAVLIPTVAGEGALGVFVAEDPIGIFGEELLPLVIGVSEAGDGARAGAVAFGVEVDDGDHGWTLVCLEWFGGVDGGAAQAPEGGCGESCGGGEDEGAAGFFLGRSRSRGVVEIQHGEDLSLG